MLWSMNMFLRYSTEMPCQHWLHLPRKWTRSQQCTRHKHAETTNSLLTLHIKVNTPVSVLVVSDERSAYGGGGRGVGMFGRGVLPPLPPLPALCPHTHCSYLLPVPPATEETTACQKVTWQPLPFKHSLHPNRKLLLWKTHRMVRDIKMAFTQKAMCIKKNTLQHFHFSTIFLSCTCCALKKSSISCTIITQSRPWPEQ